MRHTYGAERGGSAPRVGVWLRVGGGGSRGSPAPLSRGLRPGSLPVRGSLAVGRAVPRAPDYAPEIGVDGGDLVVGLARTSVGHS